MNKPKLRFWMTRDKDGTPLYSKAVLLWTTKTTPTINDDGEYYHQKPKFLDLTYDAGVPASMLEPGQIIELVPKEIEQ